MTTKFQGIDIIPNSKKKVKKEREGEARVRHWGETLKFPTEVVEAGRGEKGVARHPNPEDAKPRIIRERVQWEGGGFG